MLDSKLEKKKYYYLVKESYDNRASVVLDTIINDFNADDFVNYIESDDINTKSYLFVIGGDGLYTHAMKNSIGKNISVIGFNGGRRGFLVNSCPSSKDEVKNFINNLSNMYSLTVYPFKVKVMSLNIENTFFAFNDVYVNRDYDSILDFKLNISGNEVDILGDGIIVSSPLGSTGYAYSAGGAIIPFYKGIQNFSVIKPINTYLPRNLGSICYHSEDLVSIIINNKMAKFMIDGKYIGEYSRVEISLDISSGVSLIYNSLNFIRDKIFKEQIV